LDIRLIGYDLLEENIRYLESGVIDFLIYQNPGMQTILGISTLVDHIVYRTDIPACKILPVEIVIRENIENYIK
jgi:LacI family transcriptional regulator